MPGDTVVTMEFDGNSYEKFKAARDLLLEMRQDYQRAVEEFSWPNLAEFNWALDWFDALAISRGDSVALRVVEEDGNEEDVTFAAMKARSDKVASCLQHLGVKRGDRMLVVLGNVVQLWETLIAAIKVGAVVIPATTLLAEADLADRLSRGNVQCIVADASQVSKFAGISEGITRVAVNASPSDISSGWVDYEEAVSASDEFVPDGHSMADDPMLLYFTSGTTALPKLVEHTHTSYPLGHLTTMYWIGLQPGDVHLNLSSPGWAKHAWSSFFAPWNAEATVLVFNYNRFSAPALLDVMSRYKVTTFCAPPTVWRMMIQEDLTKYDIPLREALSAGEPLNPEVIEQVERSWGITVRDGYGQTETTLQVGNTPGQSVKPGSMGRPMPGYKIVLLDPVTDQPASEGEISILLADRPAGLMTGYRDDEERTADVMRNGHYHTGDVASVDEDGYLTYVGRADDVFKASDYRISPFELESVLIEHPAVAESAVVPSPDPMRLAVPKAYVMLAPGFNPDRETALSIMQYAREHLAPYKRIRRIEFAELPKTISGKIRRVDLRSQENTREGKSALEWWEDDFPELRSTP